MNKPAVDPRPDPVSEPPETERNPSDDDQTGIIPGKIPGSPTDPSDPRFPGSQPDLA
ncbi:hypothetical protein N825_06440 [Skermanella stibiiresistens SB22]|uniref:Uncharacterized protein n=1 Tax=Skermanella stibiiresistens SB22 TaxID=1385369 RepID=W9H6E4_9PROT|nr:hypothetical protein [Skermanella stibiiresistens]EWY39338.1 hypothetical protein N825_06440 [Skermanella stibiiresistens SB22]